MQSHGKNDVSVHDKLDTVLPIANGRWADLRWLYFEADTNNIGLDFLELFENVTGIWF